MSGWSGTWETPGTDLVRIRITTGLPTIRELSRGGSNRNAEYGHFYG
jgi:hypothetical protein